MIDMHCHLLHHMDDGAQSIWESVQLCETAEENQITKIVLTPHFDYAQGTEQFISERDTRTETLRSMLKKKNINVELYVGSEYFVDDSIFDEPCLGGMTINNSRYLLIEFPFNGVSPDMMLSYIDAVTDMDYVPILAHPERYPYMQDDYDFINYLYGHGTKFQINASSLAGGGTREEFMLAYEMVRKNLVSVIASDAHSIDGRSNDMQEMFKFFPRDISMSYIKQVTETLPELILNDDELPSVDFGIVRRRFFSF